MVTFQQVENGIAHYIESELLNRLAGWQKWVVGAGVSMYLDKSVDMFNTLKSMPVIQALNLIDENDHIDIDTIYAGFLEQARKGSITFKIPLAGDITLSQDDVEKMYHSILNA